MNFHARKRVSLPMGLAALLLVAAGVSNARAQTNEELKNDLQVIKARLQVLEERAKSQDALERRVKEQDELIRQLQAGQAAQPAVAKDGSAIASGGNAEFEKTITDNVVRQIQPKLAAAGKTFASQFNPSIGLFLDNALSVTHQGDSDFQFRGAELALSASVDPFVRGYAIINGTPDEIEVEEAAIVTTSLPYNLTLMGGRFFADFGRLSKFHDHDLPFVHRPVVLDRFVQGEAQADGLEASYLLPTSQYATLTVGAYNKVGGENHRIENGVGRDFDQFSYLVRPATYFALGESHGVDLGASYVYTPKVRSYEEDGDEVLRNGQARHLAGVDLTYRYTPAGQAGYRGFVWSSEVLFNHENWNLGDAITQDFDDENAFGLYSYLEARLTRRYYAGFLFDFAESLDGTEGSTTAYSPYFTIWFSEFQRLRLQYTHLDEPHNHDDQFLAQWTVVLGSHAHPFRDR